MNKVCLLAAIALLGLGIGAQAAITIDMVTVGDPGNLADTTGFGSVSSIYNIGKYEVTAGQYCAFLNAVARNNTYSLYVPGMADTQIGCGIHCSGTQGNYSYTVDNAFINRPVNYISYWRACRFVNWLNNGQTYGLEDADTTEEGAYSLNGYDGCDGRTIQRNATWKWAIANEDEWYKAAYYKGGGSEAGYWLYPTQSDIINGNMANYYTWYTSYVKSTTNVGGYPYASAYGTFDQGGNVWEWNESTTPCAGYSERGLRGGSFYHYYDVSDRDLCASYRYSTTSWNSDCFIGFRVVQAYTPVPEPSSIIALLGGLTGLIGLRWRKG